jgi:hypothetical protein
LAGPGSWKSPSLQEPLKPLKRLQIEAQKEHEQAVREFEAKALVADAAREVTKQGLMAELKGGTDPDQLAVELAAQTPAVEPVRRCIVDGATVEKAARARAIHTGAPTTEGVVRITLTRWQNAPQLTGCRILTATLLPLNNQWARGSIAVPTAAPV